MSRRKSIPHNMIVIDNQIWYSCANGTCKRLFKDEFNAQLHFCWNVNDPNAIKSHSKYNYPIEKEKKDDSSEKIDFG